MRDLEHCVYHVEDHSITLGHHMRNCCGSLIYGKKNNNEEPEGTYFFGFEHLVFKADLYKERYGAKYLG